MNENRRFLAAIIIAALAKWSWRNPFVILKPGFTLLLALLPAKKVSQDIYERRLFCCRACPIWSPLTGTCGSPLVDPRVGCWCFMERKARLAGADCWARTETDLQIGWPDAIRPPNR